MADVFLSYKREDQQIAREVAADLEAEGFSVFFDVRIDVGDSWDERIERELNAALACVVLWSPKSRESPWVRREAREASNRQILCPATVRRCKIPLEFSDVQTSDLIDRRRGDHWHVEWRRLCEGVGRCVGRRPSGGPDPAAAAITPTFGPKAPRPLSRRAIASGMLGTVILGGGAYFGWTQWQAARAAERVRLAASAWDQAREANTRAAYHAFLREYPDSPAANEARASLNQLPLVVREVSVLRGHRGVINHATFDREDLRVLTASIDRTARLWDASTGEPITEFVHTDRVNGAALSPDGALVATVSDDMNAVLWDAVSGRRLMTLIDRGSRLNNISFNHDGSRVAVVGDQGFTHIHDTVSGRAVAVLRGHSAGINSVEFSHDSRRLVTASNDYTARVWTRVATQDYWQETHVLPGVQHDPVDSASFSRDGARIVISTGYGPRIFDAGTGLLIDEWESIGTFNASFSPDGSRLVTASHFPTPQVWDIQSRREIAAMSGHEGNLSHAEFSTGGTQIVSAATDNTARIWEIDEFA